jgi:hypothetical protein
MHLLHSLGRCVGFWAGWALVVGGGGARSQDGAVTEARPRHASANAETLPRPSCDLTEPALKSVGGYTSEDGEGGDRLGEKGVPWGGAVFEHDWTGLDCGAPSTGTARTTVPSVPYTSTPCDPVWTAGGGWCGHDATHGPALLHQVRLFDHPPSWDDLRAGLLPAAHADTVPVMVGDPRAPNFVFHGRPGPMDSALNLSAFSLRRQTIPTPLNDTIDQLEEDRNAHNPSTRTPATSTPGRLLYYSAPLLAYTNGELARTVGSPIAALLARRLDPVAKNVSGRLQANVWLGSTTSCTPLHLDERSNLMVVVRGAKTVVLYPPGAATAAGLLPRASTFARSTLAGINGSMDLGSPPITTGGHRGRVATLRAGDGLFIPPMWLHHVCNIEPSASISVWRDSAVQSRQEALFTTALLWPPDTTVAAKVRASIYLCRMLAGPWYAHFAAHMKARYTAVTPVPDAVEGRHALCGVARPADDTIDGLWSDPADQARVTRWLTAAREALDVHNGDAVKSIVLGNAFEEMLHAVVRATKGTVDVTSDSARTVVQIVRTCL